MKGERELEEHGAELACFSENIKTRACGAFVFGGGGRFVGEALPEFGGEAERGICCDTLDPGGGVVGSDWLIERGVDFDGVEELSEECRFVKALWAARRIDEAGPIGVGPAGRANAQVTL